MKMLVQMTAAFLLFGIILCSINDISRSLPVEAKEGKEAVSSLIPPDYRSDSPDNKYSILLRKEALYLCDNEKGSEYRYCDIELDIDKDYESYEDNVKTSWTDRECIIDVISTTSGLHHGDYRHYAFSVPLSCFSAKG